MKVSSISKVQFNNNPIDASKEHKKEFIDFIVDNVKNPRDVQDCVAVPRGIFKAYILLMIGSSLGMISGALPQKWKIAKILLNTSCAIFSAASAVYFAKPFAFKGLSETVKREDINKS